MSEPLVITAAGGKTATLYHDVSENVLPKLSGVNTVITDPPYDHPHMGGGGCFQDSNPKVFAGGLSKIIDSYDIPKFFEMWLATGADNIITFCSNLQILPTLEAAKKHDLLSTVLVWWKYNAAPMVNNTWWPDAEYILHHKKAGAYINNDVDNELKRRVRRRPMVSKEEFNGLGRGFHPTAKPVGLVRELIDVLCVPGGTVLDSFMGSGATGVAAINAGCNFIGVERAPCVEDDSEHFSLATERITKACKQKGLF